MYLFFDTETSGMIQRELPANHEEQPRLVQLAAILTDDVLVQYGQLSVMIRPEGSTFDEGAVKVHGITEEMADRFGVSLRTALWGFAELAEQAQFAIAHNIEFDQAVMDTQFQRIGMENPLEHLKLECTMMMTKPICMLESRRGMGFKAPSLCEAHRHFFGTGVDNAHDALADTHACLEIFRAVKRPVGKGQLSLFGT
jgi:DNA polymerase-3 subunit epsilon